MTGLWGGVMLVCCGWLCGTALGQRQQQKLHQRRLLCSYLECFYGELEYSLAPLDHIARQLAQHPSFGGFGFARWCGQADGNLPFYLQFGRGAKEFATVFGPQIAACLETLAGQLGNVSAQSQLAALQHCRRLVEQLLAEQQPKIMQNTRLCRSLGLLGGAAAVILLW